MSLPVPVIGTVIVVLAVPKVLKASVPAAKFNEPVPLSVMVLGPGLREPLKTPAHVIAPSKLIMKVPWFAETVGPAEKHAALAEFQATSEPGALCVETVDHCALVVSQVPLPPIEVVPFGFQ